MPSLYDKFAEKLEGTPPAELLPPFPEWQKLMRQWLAKPDPTGMNDPLDRMEIEAIVADPPMPFFVMFEAAHVVKNGKPSLGGGGRSLGPFGSLIVAEALFDALKLHPGGVEANGATQREQIAACCAELLGDRDALALVPEIASMPKLLEFMGSSGAFCAPK